MMNQPEPKGLSTGKAALIGTAVAVPLAIGAFYMGYRNNPGLPSPTTQTEAQNANQPPPTPASTTDLRIKGNRKSRIYHLKGCASYDRISDKNVVWFKTVEEAEAAGYRMAKNC